MAQTCDHNINLGFTDQKFRPGVHACQIFNSDEEREEALLQFVYSGLKSGERVSCFSEKVNDKIFSYYLEQYGISLEEVKEQGRLVHARTGDVYFDHDCFEPDRMLNLLEKFHKESQEMNFSGARVIGEMTTEIQHIKGGERLLEYESKVSMLLKRCPVTAVCQYDANTFDGALVMDILKVHPFMIIKGRVVSNPFYMKPEEYLKEIGKA